MRDKIRNNLADIPTALSYSGNNSPENNATGEKNFTTKHCLPNASTNVLVNEIMLNMLLAEPHSSLLMFLFPKPPDVYYACMMCDVRCAMWDWDDVWISNT